MVGHGVRVAEELVVTQAHVAEHRVKPVVETVTTEIQVAKPDFTLKEVREQQEIVIKIPEPHLVLKKIPYDLEVELPRPPQQPKRDIITQTGGTNPQVRGLPQMMLSPTPKRWDRILKKNAPENRTHSSCSHDMETRDGGVMRTRMTPRKRTVMTTTDGMIQKLPNARCCNN